MIPYYIMLISKDITFLEKPVTDDELAIAKIMCLYQQALSSNDLDLLLSLFHEDARIDSRAAGEIVSKEQYAISMRKTLPLMGSAYFRDMLIRTQSVSAAIAYGFSRYTFRGRLELWQKRTWKFTRVGKEWKIAETHYQIF